MNREAILRTLMIERDPQSTYFICRSPLCPEVGSGATKEEAISDFKHLLAERYVAFLEKRLSGQRKRGRPAKRNVDIHLQLKANVRTGLLALSQELDISQGEVVELLLNQFMIYRGLPPIADKDTVDENELAVQESNPSEYLQKKAQEMLSLEAELPWFVAAERSIK